MALDCDGDLILKDVILRLEIGGGDAEDVGKRGPSDGRGMGGYEGVCADELGEPWGREGVLGGDVEGRAIQAVGWWELGR